MSVVVVAVGASLVVAIVVTLAFALITRWVGKSSIAFAIALAVIGVVVALFPFGLSPFKNGTQYYGIPSRCRPPIVSAWRRERFPHTPLPQPSEFPSCVDPARRRLALAGVLIAGGALMVILPRRRHAHRESSLPT